MPKLKLTDRRVDSLKFGPAHGRYEEMDSVIAGLGVRVSDKGTKTWILKTRFPGHKQPARRALGEYPSMTLAEARDKASEWRKLIGQGFDPALVEARNRDANIKAAENTFGVVFSAFCTEKLPGERKAREVERDVRNNFLPTWASRPITEITDLDVLTIISAKKKVAPVQARNLLSVIKRVFVWAVDQRVFGLKTSPAEGLKSTRIVGKMKARTRILSNAELFALWRAARRMPYPAGAVYQMLTLTGLRLNEVADASWREFDLANRLWTIPAERMKGGRAHIVPITPDILRILETLPRFKGGVYLFSATGGRSAVWMSSQIKKALDARMLRTLRALARRRGDDPADIELPHWINHDIRRSVRSQLSRLKISEAAREAVLAHARPGIAAVYDHHDYLEEKTEALELWAARLRGIVEPKPPDNVVSLRVNKSA